jgi:excisionase family DNA binding protein
VTSTSLQQRTLRAILREEIAEHPGAIKDTVYTWVSSKHMPGNRIGRFWKFKTVEVDDWVRAGGTARATTGRTLGGKE